MNKSDYLRCPKCGQTERREFVDGTMHNYRCTGDLADLANKLRIGQCYGRLGDYEEIPPPSESEEMRALLVRFKDEVSRWAVTSDMRVVMKDAEAFLSRDTGEG